MNKLELVSWQVDCLKQSFVLVLEVICVPERLDPSIRQSAPVFPQSQQCSRPICCESDEGWNYGWALAEENKLNLFTVY